MATDYTTSPLSTKGRIVFGIGCGIITVLIRVFGALPEGVSFSIILMNILVPHIENLTRPKRLERRESAVAKLNPKAVLKPAVSLFLICLIVTALLAGVNMLTADRIAALAVQTAEDSQKVVLPNAASFEEVDEDTVKGLDGSGQLAGYVITTEAKGYGGTIEVMTGITADGSVSGVVLLSQNETPRPRRQRH